MTDLDRDLTPAEAFDLLEQATIRAVREADEWKTALRIAEARTVRMEAALRKCEFFLTKPSDIDDVDIDWLVANIRDALQCQP